MKALLRPFSPRLLETPLPTWPIRRELRPREMAIAVAIVQAPSLSIACKSGIDHPAAVCAVARRLPHLTGYTHHDLRLRLRFLPADLVEHAIIRLHAEFVAAHQRFERGRKGGAA